MRDIFKKKRKEKKKAPNLALTMGAGSSVTAAEAAGLSSGSKVKIYNQLVNEAEVLRQNEVTNPAETMKILQTRHSDLVKLYSSSSSSGMSPLQCPKVRFGRTELQMPILSLGGMRQQETWNPPEGMKLENINKEIQANFEAIAERAMSLGINHFETARGYGTSELQFSSVLKKYDRSSYILQTKVAPKADSSEFRKSVEKSFSELGLGPDGFVDLFSFHGINKPEHLAWICNDGGNYAVIEEYLAAGKIKHVGFSTHGMAPLIVSAIETNRFDYVNLHYHWCGSYTASGSGPTGGNDVALEAAKKHDMGVFIISPTDKGGSLYEPSKLLYHDCLPLTPIAYNDLWLWSHDTIHTIVIGAARPEDFDEHLDAALKWENRKELSAPIAAKLQKRVTSELGDDFFSTWSRDLPDAYENPLGVGIGYLYWLWWIVKFWGLYSYAKNRYASLEGNVKTWDDNKTADENKQLFSWVPGLPYLPEKEEEIRLSLSNLTLSRRDHVMNSIKEAHCWLRNGGCLSRPNEAEPSGVDVAMWRSAYSLCPDKPYPER